jgi:hypothetical protein
MSHDIDIELLTALGELPAREPTDDELKKEVFDYLAMVAAPPREDTFFDRVLEAYLADGEGGGHRGRGGRSRDQRRRGARGPAHRAAHIVQGVRMLEREGAVVTGDFVRPALVGLLWQRSQDLHHQADEAAAAADALTL